MQAQQSIPHMHLTLQGEAWQSERMQLILQDTA